MILADSAIWIDHLRQGIGHFAVSLDAGTVVCHPFVVGEVALGSLHDRPRILWRMRRLEQLPVVKPDAVATFIDGQSLYGKGIGYIDAHLLASVRLAPGTHLWTRDKRLRAQAERLCIAADLD